MDLHDLEARWAGPSSARGVATVGKDRLARDPPAFGHQEPDDGSNVLDVGQPRLAVLTQGRGAAVVRHRFRAFLSVKEGGVHGTGADRVDVDAALAQFLGRRPRVVLHRRLAGRVDRVERGVGGEQRTHEGDDAAPFLQHAASLLYEKEGSLGVGIEAPVVVGLGHIGDGLLDHHASGVDGDVDPAEVGSGLVEQFHVVLHHRQVSLESDDIGAFFPQRGGGCFGFSARAFAVVVQHQTGGTGLDELRGDQRAQVLAAACDDGDFVLQGGVCHGGPSEKLWFGQSIYRSRGNKSPFLNQSFQKTPTIVDMDRIDHLRIFVRIATCGSFTQTADQLGLPRATVSIAMQQLETRLGARLLYRTTRRVSLTQEGEALLERAATLVADMDELEQQFKPVSGSLSGRLRVDVPSRIARRLIAPALPAYLALHPQLVIDLGSSDRVIDLVQEGVDCALRVGTLAPSSLVARPMGHFELINCASPDYLDLHGKPASPDELTRHWVVDYVSPTSGRAAPWEWVQDGQTLTAHAPSRVSTNNAETYIACALAGMGLIQIPAFDVNDHLRSGELVEVMPSARPAPMPVQLVYPHRRHLSRRIQSFAHWMSTLLEPHLNLETRPATSVLPLPNIILS